MTTAGVEMNCSDPCMVAAQIPLRRDPSMNQTIDGVLMAQGTRLRGSRSELRH